MKLRNIYIYRIVVNKINFNLDDQFNFNSNHGSSSNKYFLGFNLRNFKIKYQKILIKGFEESNFLNKKSMTAFPHLSFKHIVLEN